MNRAELIGGVLYASPDPQAAAEALLEALRGGGAKTTDLHTHRLEPALVNAARVALAAISDDEARIACLEGAAWAMGRKSAPHEADTWEPVVTFPADIELPKGMRRTTGETIIGLINGARQRVRIASPFIDREAVAYLIGPLSTAAARGVGSTLIVARSERSIEAATLAKSLADASRSIAPTIRFASEFGLWPHLKVVTVDAQAAYVGSANITGAALAGRNLELGVLLRGVHVALIDNVLDRIALEPDEDGDAVARRS